MKVFPTNQKVLVLLTEEPAPAGGLVRVGKPALLRQGVVTSVGEGVTEVSHGDTVFLFRIPGTQITLDAKVYEVVFEKDILAKLA